MLLSGTAEQEGGQYHNTRSSGDNHTSSMRLLLQRGPQQEYTRAAGRRHGRCFHLHQTLMSTQWPLRLMLLAVVAVLLVALSAAAAQAQQLDAAGGLGQEAHKEQLKRLPADTEAKLQHEPAAEAQPTLDAALAEDGLPRHARSPVSPPTVTSLQPHRRGISKAMHDTSLPVGRQSEGPSHPSLMRKAPPRRLADTHHSYTDAVARPHTMVHLPQEPVVDHLLAETASLQGGPHHTNYYTGYSPQYESVAERYHLSQNEYDESGGVVQDHQDHEDIQQMNLKIERDAEDDRRSRQRRVENSFPGYGEERNLARHARLDELLGNRHEEQQGPQRHDTFGHAISEELWSGHRRGVHPAARGGSSRNRDPSNPDDNSIWSRASSHGFRWPRTHHASTAQSTQLDRGSTAAEGMSKGSGHILFHPGSKMTNRGSVTRSEAPFNRETVVIQESGNGRVGHPRMFRPRGGSSPRESIATVSLNDVMIHTNQTYEELERNLEVKGLSLTYLLRMLNNGASLDEVQEILEFSKSPDHSGSTTTLPISQTIDPSVWEQWLNQEIEEQNRGIEAVNNHPVEIDRRGEGEPYFSDPVYAMGVHPISEEVETFQETYSDVNADEGSQVPYQPSNYSYDDYYSLEEDDVSTTSGPARIHSLTIHEIPSEKTYGDDQSGYSNDAHPHYNPLDQLPKTRHSDKYGASNDKLTSSATPGVHTQSILSEQGGWGLQRSGPLTYAVIAASAVMGSLAVFTLFVLVAYSIVKCTKKPMLNNYQVSDKKPVEITA